MSVSGSYLHFDKHGDSSRGDAPDGHSEAKFVLPYRKQRNKERTSIRGLTGVHFSHLLTCNRLTGAEFNSGIIENVRKFRNDGHENTIVTDMRSHKQNTYTYFDGSNSSIYLD
jgi:hypothetical protein